MTSTCVCVYIYIYIYVCMAFTQNNLMFCLFKEGNSSFFKYERAVFLKLNKIEERLFNVEHLLRTSMASGLPEIQDILDKPCNTPEDLEQFCKKLNDSTFRQRVVRN